MLDKLTSELWRRIELQTFKCDPVKLISFESTIADFAVCGNCQCTHIKLVFYFNEMLLCVMGGTRIRHLEI